MNKDAIRGIVDGIPHMKPHQADAITHVILENGFSNILELGFRHGVSTCYMAGAIDELGCGNIITIDLIDSKNIQPNIEQLLKRLGLSKWVQVIYEPTSYIWRLMKMIEDDPRPKFDFCYIDGAHDWFTDGFAFFLVDKLLLPGGLIIFDDLDWTFNSSYALHQTERVINMPEDEKTTPHIRKVYELLVKQHPGYSEFMEKDDWAYARKLNIDFQGQTNEIRKEVIYQKQYVGLGETALRILRRVIPIAS